MLKTYNLTPLQMLLQEESPQKLAAFLDEMLMLLVCYSDTQQGILKLADKYHMLRLIRDGFQQTKIVHESCLS